MIGHISGVLATYEQEQHSISSDVLVKNTLGTQLLSVKRPYYSS